jgi:hypothetical protein
MTEPEALPDEDLVGWPIDNFGWDWDEPGVDREPERSGPPWYRSPGPLLTLIAGAAATLVVAVTLVITDSGEIPTRPALGTKTAPTDAPSPSRAAPVTAPTFGESGPLTPASASSPAEEAPTEEESPAPAEAAEAAEPAAPAAAVPPAPVPVDSPGSLAGSDSEGPRINVTRSPMSFTPGSSAQG